MTRTLVCCAAAEELHGEVSALRTVVVELKARVEAIEGRGLRDREDRELRRVLLQTYTGVEFTAADVLVRATADVDLQHAIAGACLEGSRELGNWLSRQRGIQDGIEIVRGRRRHRWRVRALSAL